VKELTERQKRERGIVEPEETPAPAPGSKVGGAILRKVPWTPTDLEQFKKVRILPEETITVTWQGLAFTIFEGVPCELPEPHATVYEEYVKAKHSRNFGVVQTSMGEVHILGYGHLDEGD